MNLLFDYISDNIITSIFTLMPGTVNVGHFCDDKCLNLFYISEVCYEFSVPKEIVAR